MRLHDEIDFTTLGWVKQELDETLKQARQALEAFEEDPEDSSQMRFCSTYLHQVQGTLRMVELYGASMVLEEMESLANGLLDESVPRSEAAYDVLMRGIVQLPGYLERLQGGHRDVPVVLLPLLNDLRGAQAKKLLTESVMFKPAIDAPLPPEIAGPSAGVDAAALQAAVLKLRKAYEASLLQWFKADDPAPILKRMIAICDKLTEFTRNESARRVWWIAAGVLDAVQAGAIESSITVQMMFGKVGQELKRMSTEGEAVFDSDTERELLDDVSKNLLYYAAHVTFENERIAKIRSTYKLDSMRADEDEVEHAQSSLAGRDRELLDTVSGALKEDLMKVKDALDLKLRQGDTSHEGFGDHLDTLNRVANALGMLDLPVPQKVILDQHRLLEEISQGKRDPDEQSLLDMAGSLLYVEALLEDNTEQLGQSPAQGAEPGDALGLPRSEVRKILDSLMKEASGNLQEIKQSIVDFIEAPWDHERVGRTPAQLDEIAGALRMLELTEANQLLSGIESYISVELLTNRTVPNGEQLDSLADSVASLEYYLEAVSEQRPGRDKILLIGTEALERLGYADVDPAAKAAADAAATAKSADEKVDEGDLAEFQQALEPDESADQTEGEADEPVDEAAMAAASAVAAAGLAAAASSAEAEVDAGPSAEQQTEEAEAPEPESEGSEVAHAETVELAEAEIEEPVLEPVAVAADDTYKADISEDIDDEIREIFIEEVEEELENLNELYPKWRDNNEDIESLTTIRRIFHTLKGSGRLVGALTIGEFSWSLENMVNRVLDGTRATSPAVIGIMDHAVEALPQLLANVKGEGLPTADIDGIAKVADRIAEGEEAEFQASEVAPVEADVVVPEPVVEAADDQVDAELVDTDDLTIDADTELEQADPDVGQDALLDELLADSEDAAEVIAFDPATLDLEPTEADVEAGVEAGVETDLSGLDLDLSGDLPEDLSADLADDATLVSSADELVLEDLGDSDQQEPALDDLPLDDLELDGLELETDDLNLVAESAESEPTTFDAPDLDLETAEVAESADDELSIDLGEEFALDLEQDDDLGLELDSSDLGQADTMGQADSLEMDAGLADIELDDIGLELGTDELSTADLADIDSSEDLPLVDSTPEPAIAALDTDDASLADSGFDLDLSGLDEIDLGDLELASDDLQLVDDDALASTASAATGGERAEIEDSFDLDLTGLDQLDVEPDITEDAAGLAATEDGFDLGDIAGAASAAAGAAGLVALSGSDDAEESISDEPMDLDSAAEQLISDTREEQPSGSVTADDLETHGVPVDDYLAAADAGDSAGTSDLELSDDPTLELDQYLDGDLTDDLTDDLAGDLTAEDADEIAEIAVAEEAVGDDLQTTGDGEFGAHMDPVLYDILRAEVTGHLDVVRQFRDDTLAADQPVPVNEGLLRAVHTLNGAVSMTDVPPLARITAPFEGYIKRLCVAQLPMTGSGLDVVDNTIHVVDAIVDELAKPNPELPDTDALGAQLAALRDELPDGDAMSLLLPIEEDDQSTAASELVESERLEAERLEAEHLEAERLEAERLELERLEAERLEAERLEAERLEAERIEAERLEAERIEAERIDAERLEAERLEAEKAEQERLEAEQAEQERLDAEQQAIEAQTIAAGAAVAAGAAAVALSSDDDEEDELIPLADLGEVDDELMEIFLQEGIEILDTSDHKMAEWRDAPEQRDPVIALQRELHTLKGGARMAGLAPVGDLSHVMESIFEAIVEDKLEANPGTIEVLEQSFDRLHNMIDRIGKGQPVPTGAHLLSRMEAILAGDAPVAEAAGKVSDQADGPAADVTDVPEPKPAPAVAERTALDQEVQERGLIRPQQELIRVRADLLDNLVNNAGEVSIYRSRLEQQVGTFRFNLIEHEQTVTRLRNQLRNLEIETETQILSRFKREASEMALDESFDPLEMDRFSTIQQLSRALAESVSDLTSIGTMLSDLTRESETLLLQQSRVASDLQEGLMRTRMVPFDSLVPRLRRIVRQTASELGKKAQLRVDGAHGEMDRTVLERVTAPLEHMLRNAVAHGLEKPKQRKKAGKSEEGTINLQISRESTEVVLTVTDDGAGIDHERIREKALERGMLKADAELSERDLFGMILETGFSTADTVTKVAGRGVGMDVVNTEIKQLGGLLEIDSERGKGSVFTVRLPFTLAVTNAIMVKVGETSFAIPLTAIEGVVRIRREEFFRKSEAGELYEYSDADYQLLELSALLGLPRSPQDDNTMVPVLMTRVGDQHAAVLVDVVIGSREVVVKSVGPQIASVPGIFGATILGDGSIIMILDLGPLIRRNAALHTSAELPEEVVVEEVEDRPPLIAVVDDSITMRKVTTRVLERNEMDVMTAKDGVDAVEQLQERIPDLMLLDIEMPRMDGYELATHMRNDERLKGIPIIMITSRTGAKHRERAMEIGVNRYLGKPYQEAELMQNVKELLAEKAGAA